METRIMSGVDDVLFTSETVALETRQHRYLIVREIVLGLLGVALVLIAGAAIISWLGSSGREALVAIGALVVGLVAGLVAGRAAWRLLCWRFTWYVVTDRRVLIRAGVTTRRTTSAWLDNVSETKLDVPYLARLLRRAGHREYGHLRIQTYADQGLLGTLSWLPDSTSTARLIEPRRA